MESFLCSVGKSMNAVQTYEVNELLIKTVGTFCITNITFNKQLTRYTTST